MAVQSLVLWNGWHSQAMNPPIQSNDDRRVDVQMQASN